MENNRFFLVDNIKALLILLVVFGHISEFFLKIPFNRNAYFIIYTFHMPAFVFCSGLFAKYKIERIRHLALVYMFFQLLCVLFAKYIMEEKVSFSYFLPYWVLWYIFALVVWLSVLPLFDFKSKYKRFFVLLLTVGIGIAIGFDKKIGYFASLSRIIVFLPFFLAGYYLRFKWNSTRINDFLMNPKVSVLTIAGVAVSVFFTLKYSDFIDYTWYFNAAGYTENGVTPLWRTDIYFAAVIWIAFLLRFMPKAKLPIITSIGQRSLNIYLLHIFVIKLMAKFKLYAHIPYWQEGATVALALVVVLMLGSAPVDFVMSKVFKIR